MSTDRDRSDRRITRDDLEAKFREVVGDVSDKTESMRNATLAAGAAAGAAVLVLVFLFGRSRGRKKTTVVEIKRV